MHLWNLHIETIVKKANKRKYYIIQLKRSGVPSDELIKVYKSLIRPLVEYACQVWHSSVPQYLSNFIEGVQEGVLKIVFPDLDYTDALKHSNLASLHDRREVMCKKLFLSALRPNHKLNHLIPHSRSHTINLRSGKTTHNPILRTNRCRDTFIYNGVNKYL